MTTDIPEFSHGDILTVYEENDQSGFRRIYTLNRDGVKHGVCYEWYPDGKLFMISHWNHGTCFMKQLIDRED
jgi:antitoxin component YwqK of YwqJK toxin-antitoxin module